MKRTMYHNAAVRIVYNSYEPALVRAPLYNRWTLTAIGYSLIAFGLALALVA